jgi:hypothetical protein
MANAAGGDTDRRAGPDQARLFSKELEHKKGLRQQLGTFGV